MLKVGVGEGGRGGESYEFSQLSTQLWVSDIVFIREGGERRSSKRWKGGGGAWAKGLGWGEEGSPWSPQA